MKASAQFTRRSALIASVAATLSTRLLAATVKDELIYIGMHGGKIHAARFDPKSGDMSFIGAVADNVRPTWSTSHPILPLIWFNEDRGATGPSSIQTLRIDRKTGALTKIGEMQSGGGSTHMWLDWPSRTLLVANYGEGSLIALPVLADGTLGPVAAKVAFAGKGPHRRQASPHAHAVLVDPTGRYVLVADLGSDRIWVHPFDRKTRSIGPDDAVKTRHMTLPPGTGPRHLTFHPNGKWVYLVEELTGNVASFAWNAKTGRLTLLQVLSTDVPTYTGERSAAEVAVSADGRFVYTSNRSDHAMVVHAVDPKTGTLTRVQRLPSGGPWPWHFALHRSGKWLLVANRDADALALFSVDKRTGLLTDTGKRLATPRPVHVAFTGL